jgi:hypothetical protein
LGRVVPLAAIAVSLLILAGASTAQLVGGTLALATGAVLFVINSKLNVAGERSRELVAGR